jgi:hypothetical protein
VRRTRLARWPRWTVPLVCASALLLSRGPSIRASASERIYVSVADSKAQPVRGLTVADFTVALDGREQEVLTVEPATEPVSILIATDRLGMEPNYHSFFLGTVLNNFVKQIRQALPGSQFAITTFDGPVVHVASFATPPAEIDKRLGRLATNQTTAALLDAIMDLGPIAAQSPTPRRVILALFAGYRPEYSVTPVEKSLGALYVSGASLWAVEARSSATNMSNPHREDLVGRGTKMSGGRFEAVGSPVGVETILKRMAALIGAQYVVTYGPGGGNVNGARAVGVKRPGLTVHAPAWILR